MEEVYNENQLFDISDCEIKFIEIMSTEWKNSMALKPKLRTYALFKDSIKTEQYVKNNISRSKRSIFAQFRLGILPLMIETGRFKNVKDEVSGMFRKMKIEERLCKLCGMNLVEDELHFLLDCKIYDSLRKELFKQISLNGSNELLFTSKIQTFTHLINEYWKYTINYIYDAWNLRKTLLYNI